MLEDEKEIIILVEYIKLSPNREKVIKALDGNPLKPSEISKKAKIHINTASKALKQLKEHDLVYLLNPEAKRGRIYELTEKGESIVKNLYN